MNRAKHFEKIAKECQALFEKKNKAYGDDYFTGGYSDLERWMSVKRKIARLSSKYEKGNEGMPEETIKDTWMDLAIYSMMELMMMETIKTKEPKEPKETKAFKKEELVTFS